MCEDMYENHYYTLHGKCPCVIGAEAVLRAAEIFESADSTASFVAKLESQRVIGRRIWYEEDEDTIFIAKMYACESGGGCPGNTTLIGERCHCDHYNHSKGTYPKYFCKCGAEFYRPMFAPLFGDNVLIEPFNTVLSGDEECIIAIRIGKEEAKKLQRLKRK